MLDVALAVLLVAVLPLVSAVRFQRLRALLRERPEARAAAYLTAIAGQWVLAGAAFALRPHEIRALLSLPTLSGGAFVSARAAPWVLGLCGGAVLALVIAALRVRHSPEMAKEIARALESVRPLLPATLRERRLWVLVSITAGLCEEVLYRGFLTRFLLERLSPELAAVALASIAFGIAHLYQGVKGVVSTAVLGLLLALCTLAAGSLWPAIVLHALVDVRVLALPLEHTPSHDA